MKFPANNNLVFVPVDFTQDSLRNELINHDYNEEKLSFFSLLGVSMYLSKNDLFQLLTEVSEMSMKGSSCVFDYLDDTAFINEKASKKIIQMRQIAAQAGEPMLTGVDPLELDRELEGCNMLLYENLLPANINEHYFLNRDDGLQAFDHFHFAHLAVHK